MKLKLDGVFILALEPVSDLSENESMLNSPAVSCIGRAFRGACIFLFAFPLFCCPDAQSAELSESQAEALEILVDNLETLIAESESPEAAVSRVLSGSVSAPLESWPAEAVEHFESRIRPVLIQTCLKCHGGDKTNSGLRVDSREALLKGGESGKSSVVPGKPEESYLIAALRHDGELKMPPEGPLGEAVLGDFTRWIAEGAPWPTPNLAGSDKEQLAASHWAFQPMRDEPPPAVDSEWSDHPVDKFIESARLKAGLKPVQPTDKRTLIRRATFDLTGLPPTPEEVDAFLADESPEAYDKVIERLLDSPRYGERWGRHWMDVARYADTAGDAADYPVPELRFYRDYIIDSFNQDKPYDRFVKEQLAGDILAKSAPREEYDDLVIATGFVAVSRRFGTGPFQTHHEVIEDTIDTVGRAFLGLTMKCARCHDHKFDPVTAADYYGLYGMFSSTQYPHAGSEMFVSHFKRRTDFVPVLPPEAAEPLLDPFVDKIEQYETVVEYIENEGFLAQEVKRLEAQTANLEKVLPASPEVEGVDVQVLKDLLGELKGRLSDRMKSKENESKDKQKQLHQFAGAGYPENVTSAYAVREGTIANAKIQIAGSPGELGEEVPRRPPEFLQADKDFVIPGDQSGRLQLAEWIVQPTNPLTARVMVNRIWQNHFGRGIVGSPSNFGLMGETPSHPELLDWLAQEFIRKGWSIKSMHRLLMTSKTYQLSSVHDPALAEKDPDNKLYWRFDRNRLDAESIRDAMLAVSGKLDLSRPGRHPFPPLSDWRYTQHDPFREFYPSTHRSVYVMTQRIQRHPYLALFDGPDTNRTTEQRVQSSVPLQALFLLNNPFVEECAAAFGDRIAAVSGETSTQIATAYQLAWNRPPDQAEIATVEDYLKKYRETLIAEKRTEEEATQESWKSFARLLLTANEFVFVD